MQPTTLNKNNYLSNTSEKTPSTPPQQPNTNTSNHANIIPDDTISNIIPDDTISNITPSTHPQQPNTNTSNHANTHTSNTTDKQPTNGSPKITGDVPHPKNVDGATHKLSGYKNIVSNNTSFDQHNKDNTIHRNGPPSNKRIRFLDFFVKTGKKDSQVGSINSSTDKMFYQVLQNDYKEKVNEQKNKNTATNKKSTLIGSLKKMLTRPHKVAAVGGKKTRKNTSNPKRKTYKRVENKKLSKNKTRGKYKNKAKRFTRK